MIPAGGQTGWSGGAALVTSEDEVGFKAGLRCDGDSTWKECEADRKGGRSCQRNWMPRAGARVPVNITKFCRTVGCMDALP
mmetsp:Transcript_32105/g.47795  ORF Transcript_32105/g.47795 Transcript_32105/m.47795 type:complete len:81 (+) Transcript_32105:97-339(+)